MRPLELANKYMKTVFTGTDLDDLYQLFTIDLSFKGPLYEFDTAEAYIKSLKSDPPTDFEFTMINSFETESSACLIYHFSKPGVSCPMAQLFEISSGKISKILLMFDTGAFVESGT